MNKHPNNIPARLLAEKSKARAMHDALLRWYDANRRTLPWRESPSPYRTWISEIMLQQTQVATVLPYYERFLRRFPTIESLSQAGEAEVLKYWAGLGYYSRARNLRRAAQIIAAKFSGQFPSRFEDVLDLPGIGRYTAGAILSIAFSKPYPVLDGNVARVFARLFGIKEDIKSSKIQPRLWEAAEGLIHLRRPGDWNQALMELGALVCVPESPRCGECPLSPKCFARKRQLQELLPKMPQKRDPVQLKWTCLWVERGQNILLWKRSEDERFLPGHWALPERRHLNGLSAAQIGRSLRKVQHTITHHKISVNVIAADLKNDPLPPNARWVSKFSLRDFLVSSLWTKCVRN